MKYPSLLLSCLCCLAAAAETPPLSAICIEADTGRILEQENAAAVRPPASMLKMMLMLAVAEGLDAGDWTLDTPVSITQHAQVMGGTQVYLEAGESWPLGHLMQAVAIASANDAAMAVAEGLWGTEEDYLRAANARAQALGMEDTVLRSVHGLPPDAGEKADETNAKDMARLARACVQHPQILEWTSQQVFQFRPEGTDYYSTNKLLWRLPGCDGLKTGYIRAAGFCVTATAERNGIRLISVVMGAEGNQDRFNRAAELIERGFTRAHRIATAKAE